MNFTQVFVLFARSLDHKKNAIIERSRKKFYEKSAIELLLSQNGEGKPKIPAKKKIKKGGG